MDAPIRQPAKPQARSRRVEKTQRVARAVASNGDGALLAAIKAAGGSIAPGELAEKLKLSRYAVKKQAKPLIKSGQIVATGSTFDRRFSLPGRPAKEAL